MEAVYTSADRRECRRQALVLEAAGIRYRIQAEAGEYAVFVAEQDAERARAEFDAYEEENRDWQTRPAPLAQRFSGWEGVFAYVSVLLLVSILAQWHTFSADWFKAGKTHAGLICDGQLWRTVTALTLHSDIRHLFANVAIGGLIGLFAGQMLGSGLAWVSILFAGAMGNLLNAMIRPPNHTSVGASTAVFAALGLVVAYVWKRRRHLQASRLTRWTPIVVGVVLLGYLGTGGVRTDVAAHVTGFLAGVVLGAIYGKLGDRVSLKEETQAWLALSALAILALSWALALAPHDA